MFHNRCVVCRYQSDHVHEIEPRSARPYTWNEWTNQVTLCASCHTDVHDDGAYNRAEGLRDVRDQRLREYYGYEIPYKA